jgi:hypothetical protein
VIPGIKIALTLILFAIVFQDFKHRGVYWFLFPLAFVLSIGLNAQQIPMEQWVRYFLFNLLFIGLQLLVLLLYFKLKEGAQFQIKNLFQNKLGLGDVLFFVVLAGVFSPVNFLLFFVITLLFALVLAILFRNRWQNFPLAGIMAVTYIPLLWLPYLMPGFSTFSNLIYPGL